MTATDISRETAAQDPAMPDVRAAAVRPFGRPGRGWWLLAAAMTAVVLVGLAAWVTQLRDGMGVAGYNDHAFWAVYIADVVTFIGVSYGGAVISAILRLTGAAWRAPLTRLAEGTAVVTVLVGAAFIIPHLGRPDRVWELLTRPNLSSPIFWDFVAVMTYTAASIVFFALPLVPDTWILGRSQGDRLGRRRTLYASIAGGWQAAPGQRKVLNGALGLISIMIIPLAVSVHSVLSWAFSLTSRPWWHESIWAPYFVVAALYSGVALVILVVAAFRRAYHLEEFITPRHFVRLGFIMVAFAATYLYLTLADLLPGAYVGDSDDAAVFQQLLVGRYAPAFWLFVVAAGVVPILLVALPWTRTVPGMVTAAALVVPAMWLKRMLMVLDPGNYDRITQLFGTYHFTWVSVSVTLAGAAAIVLLLMLLFRLVPVLSVDEIEQEEAATAGAAAPARVPVPKAAGAVGVLLLILAGAVVFNLATARPAAAANAAPDTITLHGTAGPGTVRLVATLSGAGGQPVANARVQFLEVVTEFGSQGNPAVIGSAVTDSGGTARLVYQPTVGGNDGFIARYAAGANATPVSATTSVAVTAVRQVYQAVPGKPLSAFGRAFVGVLIAIVIAVWVTLAVQVGRVRRACRMGAR